MKTLKYSILLAVLLVSSCSKKIIQETNSNDKVVFHWNLEKNDVGNYTDEDLGKDIGKVNWKLLEDRATIEEDAIHGKVLKVKFPKGTVGPKQGGIQFDKPLAKATEYYLDYYVKFKEGFDFALGGKLPGLTSGGEKYTGGTHPTNGEGWSARYMWRKDGEMIVYFYFVDMEHRWGDIVDMSTSFKTGEWHRITQHLKMNTGKKANGIMEIWVDAKKVVDKTTIRYRFAPLGEIDSFYFSTFHGGNTVDWAPQNDSYIYFDDFKVSTQKPNGLD